MVSIIFPYLPQDEYDKAKGQLGMQATGVFDFLKVDEKLPVKYIYGLGVYIPGASAEIVDL